MTIKFLKIREPYGFCSNFYRSSFEWRGYEWATSEHAYQAAKFFETDPEWAELIAEDDNPWAAKKMGSSREHPIPEDWDDKRVEVMLDVVRAKFAQNQDLAEQLLETGDERIEEDFYKDSFWANGGDGTGKNILGRILMKVRAELKEESDG